MATRLGAQQLAFGYAGYQSEWPEQTAQATTRLRSVLVDRGIELLLPAYDIETKDAAVLELERYGLSTGALEQKCLQQQFNVALTASDLDREIAAWEQALSLTLSSLDDIHMRVIAEVAVSEVRDA